MSGADRTSGPGFGGPLGEDGTDFGVPPDDMASVR